MGRWSDDASFDRTLSLFILNFVPDAAKAVREMLRVTRQGPPSRARFGVIATGLLSPFLEKQGPAGVYAGSLDSDSRERLRLRRCQHHLGDGTDRPFVLDARAWAVRVRKD